VRFQKRALPFVLKLLFYGGGTFSGGPETGQSRHSLKLIILLVESGTRLLAFLVAEKICLLLSVRD